MRSRRLEVLLVDDDARIRRALRGVLEDEGHSVDEAPDGARALSVLGDRTFDAVLLDVNMPGMSGLDALVSIREMAPQTGVIMVSGEGTVATAVQALKRGAFDFIEKPVDPEHLLRVLAQAAQLTELRRASPAGAGGEPEGDLGLIGSSPAMTALLADIRRVAPSQAKVLITGENGAGKDLVAEAIHRLSHRAGKPFVKVNCAAIPRDLVESELFGHEKGAFTGALQRKVGRLERADQGTLFLDEIGDLSAESQAKLLRALETGEVDRIGATDTIRVDVRVLAATNKDLAEAMETGEFRRDLFYRLNGVPLLVPPLRERRADIPALANHFLGRACAAEGKPAKRLTPEALALLEEYRWPGNVRELENVIERALILCDEGVLDPEHLPMGVRLTPQFGHDHESDGLPTLEEVERRYIRRVLEECKGHRHKAAAILGISERNLYRKLKELEQAAQGA